MSSSTKKVTVFPKMNKVKRGVVSACPNWLDMAPLYIISLCMNCKAYMYGLNTMAQIRNFIFT